MSKHSFEIVARKPALGRAAIIALALAVPALAQQADRARTETLARRATERLRALQQEADRLVTEERTLLGDLRRLELDRQIKTEELRQVEADSAKVAAELAQNAGRMEQLERLEAAVRPELRARLIEVYKLGQGRYLRLLLATSTFQQLGQASRMVAALAKIDRDRVASHKLTIDELKKTRGALEQRRRRLDALRSETERARAAVDRAATARNVLIRDIDHRRDLNAQLVAELEMAQQKLQLALRDLAAGVPAAEPLTLPLRPFRGDLDWPLKGRVTRAFGRGSSQGIEIDAVETAPVSAIHEGVVAFADAFSGFGNLVILDHASRTFSVYGNLMDIAVKRGDHVDRGQVLGTVGAAPAGPPELHFELRIDGQSVDPLQWLRRR